MENKYLITVKSCYFFAAEFAVEFCYKQKLTLIWCDSHLLAIADGRKVLHQLDNVVRVEDILADVAELCEQDVHRAQRMQLKVQRLENVVQNVAIP